MNANVMEIGHKRLDDGQHTKAGLNILKVIERRADGDYIYKSERDLVIGGLAIVLSKRQTDIIVTIPMEGRKFAEDADLPVPRVRLWEAEGSDRAKFDMDDKHRQAVSSAGRIAIFDCVVGNSPAPMYARHRLRQLNPDAEIDLISVWQRADPFPIPHPSTIGAFAEIISLVDEPLKAVPAEDCFLCPDK